jgi:alanine racemase
VSYGARYVTERTERIATLAIGYADGLPWSLTGGGEAIVLGRRVPIRGAVCMDVTAVDVSGVPEAGVGTVATLLGSDGEETITLDDLARKDRTIEYEILTGFGRRLPRVYTGAPDRS